ncbi:inhibitor i9 domain-containing protein [Parachaetomium inaequale]|uniref:Inhibitor i9 domain-containing protein n=1 Tax=Parachaetomium inaequale TaxID=2588326 RepID=A0AAN6PII5_9PEZI|nr:inhibitor i9 domain-containing protein [Parachaetomium inaequale]
MPVYNVICNENTTQGGVEEVMQYGRDKGGTVGQQFTLVNGFQVSFDDDAHITAMRDLPSVEVVEEE